MTAKKIERWPDRSPVSQDNAFRVGYLGAHIDTKRLSLDAARSAATTRHVNREQAAGINRSKLPGLSKKADQRLREGALPKMMKRGKK